MYEVDGKLVRRANWLVHRLERLSADSSFAHQASGFRGAIIRRLDLIGESGSLDDPEWMLYLVDQAERILIEAAKQFPESD